MKPLDPGSVMLEACLGIIVFGGLLLGIMFLMLKVVKAFRGSDNSRSINQSSSSTTLSNSFSASLPRSKSAKSGSLDATALSQRRAVDKQIFESLILSAQNGDLNAAETLGRTNDAHDIELLIEAIKDTRRYFRGQKTYDQALLQIGVPAVIPIAMELNDLKFGSGDRSLERYYKIVAILAQIRPFAEGQLLTVLESSDDKMRQSAAFAIGEIADWRFSHDRNFNPLSAADRRVLDEINSRIVQRLISLLSDDDDLCRGSAAQALGKIEFNDGGRVVESLLSSLQDDDPAVRFYSVSALEEKGGIGAVPSLIAVLQEDDDETVRAIAARRLGDIGDKRAIEPLAQALKDSSEDVRLDAAMSLGNLGDVRAANILLDALADPQRSLNLFNLGVALEKACDGRCVKRLTAILQSEDRSTRETTAQILAALYQSSRIHAKEKQLIDDFGETLIKRVDDEEDHKTKSFYLHNYLEEDWP